MNPFAIFARSWQGLNLSPGERAFMKLVSGVLFTAIGAGALVAVQQFTQGNTDYHAIAVLAGGAAAKTLFDAIKKYLAAQTDVPLPAPSLASPPAPPAASVPLSQQETTKTPVVAPLAPAVQFVQQPPKFTTPVPQPPNDYTINRDWSAQVAAMPPRG